MIFSYKLCSFLCNITSTAVESAGKRKAPKSNFLAFPAKKKSKFHGKHYSVEAKDISKAADWVKLAVEKQKRGQKLILSETDMCFM